MIRFTTWFLVWGSGLLVGYASGMNHPRGSFSIPEQALFGSSFAEDCVLGSTVNLSMTGLDGGRSSSVSESEIPAPQINVKPSSRQKVVINRPVKPFGVVDHR